MATFLALTALEGVLPKTSGAVRPAAYALFYTVKVALVSLVLWSCRRSWDDLKPRPSPGWILASVLSGAVVIALWIGLDGRYPSLPLQGKRAGFDPGTLPGFWRIAFVGVRLYGLVLVVPLMEELFWRSFLIRWIAAQNFTSEPIGRVTWLGAIVTSALFALAHPEWLPALLTGLLWAGMLWRSRSVSTCWISHLAANLLLGGYVLVQSAWRFW